MSEVKVTRVVEPILVSVVDFFLFICVFGHIAVKVALNNLRFGFIRYLGNEKLPNRMLSLQSRNTSNLESASGEEDGTRNEEIPKNLSLKSCPFEVGGLQIISLGTLAS